MNQSSQGHASTGRELQSAPVANELTTEQIRFRVSFPQTFQTTAELTGTSAFVGQDRAQAALDLGVGITNGGFNIFVSGLTGTEKLQVLRDWVTAHVRQAPTPNDWVYVHNFVSPDAPRAIALPAGRGCRLKQRMHDLIKTLQTELPKAFRQEAFDKEKTELKEKYTAKAQALAEEMEGYARDRGFLIQHSATGHFILVPVIHGKPLERPEEYEKLSREQKQQLEEHQQQVAEQIVTFTERQQQLMRALTEDIRAIERRFGDALLAPLIANISREMENEEVDTYLKEVHTHIVENLDHFKEGESTSSLMFLPPFALPHDRDVFLEYGVNVVVDNSQTTGAPVLIEISPSYVNLFGTIERVVDRFGRLVTNFTRIKSGTLLRAHGGYLIFNLDDAITEFGVWKTLKRMLKSGRVAMETYEPFALFATSGLKPEPIEIRTKVIVVGTPFLYRLLYMWDDEFREIFKVHADFRDTMELDTSHLLAYGQWVAHVCQDEKLPHFDQGAVERIVAFGARQAGDREKVVASFADIADLVREAAYWARRDQAQVVSAQHVQQTLDQREFRANRIEEELRELVTQGTILVDIDGRKVGQVNGLSVLQVGNHIFGQPARVTASVALGQAGIVNIERESRLSGPIHDKGLLILSGYLRNRYGQDKPLALSASLCFEQSYAAVEGDSASSTELYALLSCLAELPIRQDLAVTGSVNQWGEVQAIGGVNEKIEGFFALCQLRGLTGSQGVLIPAANVRHLMLRADVLTAVEQGQFHIYPIRTIDEGIALLTGVRAGTGDEPDTVNGIVSARLHDLAMRLKAFAPTPERTETKHPEEKNDQRNA
ncbi:MAG: Lon protease family protein [Candidatus Binatia bacterium]